MAFKQGFSDPLCLNPRKFHEYHFLDRFWFVPIQFVSMVKFRSLVPFPVDHLSHPVMSIIKGFRTIVFFFIVISSTFRLICPLDFFRCLSNSGTYTELRTTSFIESTGFTCSDFVNHNRVQVLIIPVLLLSFSQDWTCNVQTIVSLEA